MGPFSIAILNYQRVTHPESSSPAIIPGSFVRSVSSRNIVPKKIFVKKAPKPAMKNLGQPKRMGLCQTCFFAFSAGKMMITS